MDFENNSKIVLEAGGASAYECWGGAFWELRKLVGQEHIDALLYSAWVDLNRGETRGDVDEKFVKVLLGKAKATGDPSLVKHVRETFARRGVDV